MMTQSKTLERILNQLAASLEIPEELATAARREYGRLAHWLEEQDRKKGKNEPKIYSQGSFRLGTTIRPTDGDYDVDLVYERDLQRASITRQKLKEEAGELLESYVEYLRKIQETIPQLDDEGRRCWTLDYPGQFHMDILPAIPDVEQQDGILITDKLEDRWQFSNPIGYSIWFRKQSEKEFERARKELAKKRLILEGEQRPTEGMIKASAEAIPEYDVKTALQRAVQILKRHRDEQFSDDDPNRPASIIITTLAAKAYDNEGSLVETLLNLVKRMPDHIDSRYENGTKVSWVPNPVHQKENFADRWQDEQHPNRESAFRHWLQQVDSELTEAINSGSIHRIVDILGGSLGRSIVQESAKTLGLISTHSTPKTTLSLDDASHCETPHWPMATSYKVRVKGAVYPMLYGTKKLWDLSRRPVKKSLAIRFEATTNVARPFQVFWQVVNTGEEARSKGVLRGGVDEETGPNPEVHWEETEYSGTHWIEAFIVKDGICVARSGPVYVRIR